MPEPDSRVDASPAPGAAARPSARRIVAPLLWLAAGAALAAGYFWTNDTRPGTSQAQPAPAPASARSIRLETLRAGSGSSPLASDVATVNYKGLLADGRVFDQGEKVALPVADMIPGFTQALLRMQRGGSYTVFIPSELGYGAQAIGPIPANSDLIFEVELIDFKPR